MEGLWCHVIQSQKEPMTCKIRNTNQHIPACNPKSAGWMYIGFLVSTQRWAASQQSSVLCFAVPNLPGRGNSFFWLFFFPWLLLLVASWLLWLLGFGGFCGFWLLGFCGFWLLGFCGFWLLGFCGFWLLGFGGFLASVDIDVDR